MDIDSGVAKMNQQCKVCGEPAAGFHFGAFTCEGCKSFFGRSYNNLSAISECRNNGECVINKKNRTSCKACRLRKCLLVGMSKSGSRYGRRSNWFKIHCLLQEQQQQQGNSLKTSPSPPPPPPPPPLGLGILGSPFDPQLYYSLVALQHRVFARSKDELLLLGLHDCKSAGSPSLESSNSDSSSEEMRASSDECTRPSTALHRHQPPSSSLSHHFHHHHPPSSFSDAPPFPPRSLALPFAPPPSPQLRFPLPLPPPQPPATQDQPIDLSLKSTEEEQRSPPSASPPAAHNAHAPEEDEAEDSEEVEVETLPPTPLDLTSGRAQLSATV